MIQGTFRRLMMRSGGSQLSDAAAFLASYGPFGMAMDFTDSSIAINDEANTLDYSSVGTVQESTGALLGPGSLLTNTAPSLKNTEQADGYTYFQAHNLCLQSETFTSASWSASGINKTSADTLTVAPGSSTHIISQNITAVPGATYTAELELKAGTYRYVSLQLSDNVAHGVGRVLDLQTGLVTASITLGTLYTIVGTPTVTDQGGGYYKISITYTHGASGTTTVFAIFARPDGTSTTWAPTWSAAGTETFQVRKAHLRRTPSVSTYVATTSAAVYDLPYVYSGGELAGVMVEPAATNLIKNSQSLSTISSDGWVVAGSASLVNDVVGPDGVTMSLTTLTEDTTTGQHYVYGGATNRPVPGAGSVTVSVFLKAGTRQYVNVSLENSGNSFNATVDTQSWTVTQSGATGTGWTFTSASVVAAQNSTYRLIMTGTVPAATNVVCFISGAPLSTSSRSPSYLGTGATVIAGMVQIETGTVATSPIITYGSSVVRALDNITMATSLVPFSATEGTIFAHAGYMPIAGLTRHMLSVSDGTLNEWVSVRGSGSNPEFLVFDSGNYQTIDAGAWPGSGDIKLAGAWAASDAAASVNGAAAVANASAGTPVPTTFRIGGSYNTSEQYGGLIKRVASFPVRKANATLVGMTTL